MNELLTLCIEFFKTGLFAVGGGMATIPFLYDMSDKTGWFSHQDLANMIAVGESTPGPIGVNMATYVGYKKRGIAGSAMATLGVVVPSLVILYIISLFLDAFLRNKYVAYAFTGVKCGVAFLILRAGFGLLRKMEKRAIPRITFGIVFALMILFDLLSISFSSIWFILMGGVL